MRTFKLGFLLIFIALIIAPVAILGGIGHIAKTYIFFYNKLIDSIISLIDSANETKPIL